MDYEHTGKDRSLGSVELNVSTCVTEAASTSKGRWASTGKIERNDMLRVDGKRNLKGTLFYEACFYPCAEMGNIQFDAPPSILEKVKADDQSDSASTIDTSALGGHEGDQDNDFAFEEDAQRILATPTLARSPTATTNGLAPKKHKVSGSIATLASIETSKSTKEPLIPRETLLQTRAYSLCIPQQL